MQQTFTHVRPGGWVEFQDYDLRYYSEDGSFKPEHAIHRWAKTLLQASRGELSRRLSSPFIMMLLMDFDYQISDVTHPQDRAWKVG